MKSCNTEDQICRCPCHSSSGNLVKHRKACCGKCPICGAERLVDVHAHIARAHPEKTPQDLKEIALGGFIQGGCEKDEHECTCSCHDQSNPMGPEHVEHLGGFCCEPCKVCGKRIMTEFIDVHMKISIQHRRSLIVPYAKKMLMM